MEIHVSALTTLADHCERGVEGPGGCSETQGPLEPRIFALIAVKVCTNVHKGAWPTIGGSQQQRQ